MVLHRVPTNTSSLRPRTKTTGKKSGSGAIGVEVGGGSGKVSREEEKMDKIRTLASAAASQLIGMIAVFLVVLFLRVGEKVFA